MRKTNKYIIFLVCWTTYVMAYLCRVNFSSALNKLQEGFNVATGDFGLIGSLFFIVYAVGQLINGFIGDRVSPYKFISLAVFGSALLNAVISLNGNYYLIMICWALNGYFQSMFWGPLMRILSGYFSREEHAGVSTGMTTSMVVGFILSWAVLGRLLVDSSWQYYFILPSAAAFLVLIIWIVQTINNRKVHIVKSERKTSLKELWHTIISERLWLIAFICICLGMVKESISLWAPVILTKALEIDIKSSFLFIAVIPVSNFLGIIFTRKLTMRHDKNIGAALLTLFAVVAACSFALLAFSGISPLVSVVMIAVISSMTYGCNSILLSFIPLSFSHKNITSTLVGIFDFSSYMGAAVSAFVLGLILSSDKWSIIPLIWMSIGLAAVLLCVLSVVKNPAVGSGGVQPEQ